MGRGFLAQFARNIYTKKSKVALFSVTTKNVTAHGQSLARRKLVVDTIGYVRPGIILRKKFSFEIIGLDMIKHFMLTFS
jgi:hypothetical protein